MLAFGPILNTERRKMEKEYKAIVNVQYRIGFTSTSPEQAKIDAQTLLDDGIQYHKEEVVKEHVVEVIKST